MTKLKVNRLELIEKLKDSIKKEVTENDQAELDRSNYERILKASILAKITQTVIANLSEFEIKIPQGRYSSFYGRNKKGELKSPEELQKEGIELSFEIKLPIALDEFVPIALETDWAKVRRIEAAIEKLEMAQNEIIEVSDKDDYFSLI